MSISVQLTTTAKGRSLMVFHVYLYIWDRQTDEKIYWPCENHKSLTVIY